MSTHDSLKYVNRDSQEFRVFIKKVESNYESSNKQSLCLLCWGFLSSYQKKRHLQHGPYVITPSFCKNEDQFFKHALAQNKVKSSSSDNKTLVAIFNEQCPPLIENPYNFAPPSQRSVAHIPMN